MLAHLVTEQPRPAKARALDDTLDQEPVTAIAVVAYAAAPDGGESCWIPARRRSHTAAPDRGLRRPPAPHSAASRLASSLGASSSAATRGPRSMPPAAQVHQTGSLPDPGGEWETAAPGGDAATAAVA